MTYRQIHPTTRPKDNEIQVQDAIPINDRKEEIWIQAFQQRIQLRTKD